jgi:hypothetical protein
MVETVTQNPQPWRQTKTIELGGLDLGDTGNQMLRNKFAEYNTDASGPIFRVREYQNGNQLKEWGNMEQGEVGCQLLAGVEYWVQHPLPAKDGGKRSGNSVFGGRVGMTCSSSCICHLQQVSDKMSKEVEDIITTYQGKGHHRKHK